MTSYVPSPVGDQRKSRITAVQKVLGYGLVVNPGRAHTTAQLVRYTGLSVATIKRTQITLKAAGLMRRVVWHEQEGKRSLWAFVPKQHPLTRELVDRLGCSMEIIGMASRQIVETTGIGRSGLMEIIGMASRPDLYRFESTGMERFMMLWRRSHGWPLTWENTLDLADLGVAAPIEGVTKCLGSGVTTPSVTHTTEHREYFPATRPAAARPARPRASRPDLWVVDRQATDNTSLRRQDANTLLAHRYEATDDWELDAEPLMKHLLAQLDHAGREHPDDREQARLLDVLQGALFEDHMPDEVARGIEHVVWGTGSSEPCRNPVVPKLFALFLGEYFHTHGGAGELNTPADAPRFDVTACCAPRAPLATQAAPVAQAPAEDRWATLALRGTPLPRVDEDVMRARMAKRESGDRPGVGRGLRSRMTA